MHLLEFLIVKDQIVNLSNILEPAILQFLFHNSSEPYVQNFLINLMSLTDPFFNINSILSEILYKKIYYLKLFENLSDSFFNNKKIDLKNNIMMDLSKFADIKQNEKENNKRNSALNQHTVPPNQYEQFFHEISMSSNQY